MYLNRFASWTLRHILPTQRSRMVMAVTCGLAMGLASTTFPAWARADDPEPYMRVTEDASAGTMQFDLAVRFFTPSGNKSGPTIALAGAVHLANPAFYATMQSFLDSQDRVLFEGVKPRGFGMHQSDNKSLTNAERITQTEHVIRFTSIMLERYHSEHDIYPDSLQTLTTSIESMMGKRMGEFAASSLIDAWGNTLVYTSTNDPAPAFTLTSLGEDGQPNGTDANADLAFADQDPLTDAELGSDPNIQARLAKALGLQFQLNGLHHDGPNYQNSDMSIDDIERLMGENGGDSSALFSMLDGSSFSAKVMNVLLGLVERSPRMQEMTKIMLMEMLNAVGQEGMANMKQMPAEMGELFEVIINDRNQVVVDDLKTLLDADTFEQGQTIAVIYGAGHLDDLENRLADQLGYTPVGGFWVTAMDVDLEDAGITPATLQWFRSMMKSMF